MVMGAYARALLRSREQEELPEELDERDSRTPGLQPDTDTA